MFIREVSGVVEMIGAFWILIYSSLELCILPFFGISEVVCNKVNFKMAKTRSIFEAEPVQSGHMNCLNFKSLISSPYLNLLHFLLKWCL